MDEKLRQLAKEKAFNWSVDYKPWEDNLTPQEYARYGFEIGYLRGIAESKNENRIQS